MTEYSLWLYPLVFISILGIVANIRVGFFWSYGQFIKHLIVLSIAIIGITIGPDWLWTILGWVILFVFVMLPQIIITRINNALSLLHINEATKLAKLNQFFLWGPPGKYWLEICKLISGYTKNDIAQAQDVLNQIQKNKIPPSIQDNLNSFVMFGKIVIKDWQGIINDWQEITKQEYGEKKKFLPPAHLALYAFRAYCELGQFDQAILCLKQSGIESTSPKFSENSLYTTFLSFFSLLGAQDILKNILVRLSKGNGALPEYARLFWLGRCLEAKHQYHEAVEVYKKALDKTPSNIDNWRERLQLRLDKAIDESSKSNPATDNTATISFEKKEEIVIDGKNILNRMVFVNRLISGKGVCKTVNVLAVIIVSAYLIANFARILKAPTFYPISFFCYAYGILSSTEVWQGQYWRLVTYIFLHANITHLLFNVLGLVWFGKLIEKTYGSINLIILFFASGIISGLANILLCPSQMAIGASGAVMGIFGATAAAIIRLKHVLPNKIRKYELTWILTLAIGQIMLDQLVNLVAQIQDHSGTLPRIASFAHIGGMLGGFIIAFLLPMKKIDKNADGI
jgi:membrane associated rhomboid family serine protease